MIKDEALKIAIEALPELIGIAQNEYESQAKAYDNYPNMAYRYDYIKDIADEGTKALNACKEALKQSAQEPLSDDAIAELWGEKWSGSTEMIKNFARAIEKAHGIGE